MPGLPWLSLKGRRPADGGPSKVTLAPLLFSRGRLPFRENARIFGRTFRIDHGRFVSGQRRLLSD
jgi:hypothetical protein